MAKKQDWIIVLFIALLIVIVRLPSFNYLMDRDSGAVAYHARQINQGQPLYGSHHPIHHLPGIYYTFALVFKVLGDNQDALKIFLLPWIFGCALLLFLMGRHFINAQTGIVAALFYILLSSQSSYNGHTTEMEQFANLPITGGVFLGIIFIQENRKNWLFFWVGILGAICILYKAIFVAPILVTGILIIIATQFEQNQKKAWGIAVRRLAWMGIGLISPLILVSLYFSNLGLLQRLLVAFDLGYTHTSSSNNILFGQLPLFSFPFVLLGYYSSLLLILAMLGAYRYLRQNFPAQEINNIPGIAVGLWFMISFAEAGIRGGGLIHYVLLTIPVLAFMGAYQINVICESIFNNKKNKQYAKTIMGILIFLVILNFDLLNNDSFTRYVFYKAAPVSYTELTGDHKISDVQISYSKIEAVSKYIQIHSQPTDFIYVISDNVQVYYLSERKSPIDSVWPFYFTHFTSLEEIFNQQTKYIAIDTVYTKDNSANLPNFYKLLKENYFLDTTINTWELYKRLNTH